jgi:hypothetical protein
VSGEPLGTSTRRWGPYAVAGALILCDFLWLARGLSYLHSGYGPWALDRGIYSDIIKLSIDHYVRVGHYIHPLPYVHDRIEYPVLLGFILWLPSWLPGGPAAWFAAAGVLTTAATFGSIALVSRRSLRSAWWIAASPALLLDAGINWDLIGILFMVAAVVWFGEGRYRLSGVATALGTFFKLFPVVAAPMAVAALGSRWWRSLAATGPGRDTEVAADEDRDPGGRRPAPWVALARWLIPFVVVSAVVMVPFLLVARSNTLYFFRFNSERPDKDSVWVVLGRILGSSVVSNHLINTLSLLVVMAALAYGAWMVWRAPAPDQARAMALATAMALIVWMAVNKVWNPQYVLWVFAAGALVAMPPRYGVILGVICVGDWVFEFVLRLPDRGDTFAGVGYGASMARTVIFVVMIAWAVRQLRQLLDPATTVVDGASVHANA